MRVDINKILKNKENIAKLVIFATFASFAFITATFFSPIVSSNAEEISASDSSAAYTASISSDDATSISITPTDSPLIYTGTNTISYTNTCPYGFTVSMSTASSDTGLTRTGNDEELKTIPSIVAGTSLAYNTWGYSTDAGETYSPVPALDSPATILNTSTATTTAADLDLTFGIKTDNNLPSGRYTNSVIYTVAVKPECLTYGITWDFDEGTASEANYPTALNFNETIDLTALTPTKEGYEFAGWSNGSDNFTGEETNANINPSNLTSITMTAQWEELAPPMQGFDCSTISRGETIVLRDIRDNKKYTVFKGNDGRCWMSQNLRLINRTITSADTDMFTSSYTIPDSNWAESLEESDKLEDPYVYNTNNTRDGVYYNYVALSVGTVTGDDNTDEITETICPKGWTIPSQVEYQMLLSAHGITNDATGAEIASSAPLNFVYSGMVPYDFETPAGMLWGYWPTTTAQSGTHRYTYYLNEDFTNVAGWYPRSDGYPVRCIARRTMQGFSATTLAVGDTVELMDLRDGNLYDVMKLEDGRVWMTQNLAIIDKELTSSDSDIPNGTTFEVPESSQTGFSNYDVENAYVDSTYGGYYNFYTATAGSGTRGSTDDAPYSICPKGWTLPSNDEFNDLYNHYVGDSRLSVLVDNLALTDNGYIASNSHSSTGEGYYWTSSPMDGTQSYLIAGDNSSMRPYYGVQSIGIGIRCVARRPETIQMQNFDGSSLDVGDERLLSDTRDGNVYTVFKADDGSVWMSQNLRLNNKTITKDDSDITADTYTVPNNNWNDSGDVSDKLTYSYTYNSGVYEYGVYYNYVAATAGTISGLSNTDEATESICPKGWKLPSTTDFENLFSTYSVTNGIEGSSIMRSEPLNYIYSGFINNDMTQPADWGNYGYWWTSTLFHDIGRYGMYLGSSTVSNNAYGRGFGFSIRCKLR